MCGSTNSGAQCDMVGLLTGYYNRSRFPLRRHEIPPRGRAIGVGNRGRPQPGASVSQFTRAVATCTLRYAVLSAPGGRSRAHTDVGEEVSRIAPQIRDRQKAGINSGDQPISVPRPRTRIGAPNSRSADPYRRWSEDERAGGADERLGLAVVPKRSDPQASWRAPPGVTRGRALRGPDAGVSHGEKRRLPPAWGEPGRGCRP
jgi:hypothetical protein